MSTEPVWIIDHDLEDQDIVQMIWKELGLPNQLVLLNDAEEAYQRMAADEKAPFIIICEIHLRGTSGFDLIGVC